MPDLAFVLDEEGRYLEVLSGEGHLLYRTANELKGHLMHDTLPKELADHALDKIRKTIDITRKSQGTIELALFDIDPPGDKRECYDRFIH